jgi:O-antigen polymerase
MRKFDNEFLVFLICLLPSTILLLTGRVDVYGFFDIYCFFFLLLVITLIKIFAVWFSSNKCPVVITFSLVDVLLICGVLFSALTLFNNERRFIHRDAFRLLVGVAIVFCLYKSLLQKQTNYALLSLSILVANLIALIVRACLIYSEYLPIQKATTFFDTIDPFGNTGVWGNYLISLLPFAIALAHKQKDTVDSVPQKVLYVVAILNVIIILIIVPLTVARAAWLGGLTGVFVVIGFIYKPRYDQRLYALVLSSWKNRVVRILIVTVIPILAIYSVHALYALKKDSADGRMLIYKVCFNMIMDHPIIGIGLGNFRAVYGKYQGEYFQTHPHETHSMKLADNVSVAYNEYINIAVETGIIGLILFSLLMLSIIPRKNIWKKYGGDWTSSKSYVIGAFGSLVAILISGLFSYPFHTLPVAIHITFFCAVLATSSKTIFRYQAQIGKIWRSLALPILGMAACCIVIFTQYTLYREFMALLAWKNTSVKAKQGHFVQSDYSNVYQILQNNPYYLYNYGAMLLFNGEYGEGVKILKEARQFFFNSDVNILIGDCHEKLKEYQEAENSYEMAIWITPNRLYPHYALSKIFYAVGDTSKAIKHALKVEEMEVKVFSTNSFIMKSEMKNLLDSLISDRRHNGTKKSHSDP